jgi:hypothetical protein
VVPESFECVCALAQLDPRFPRIEPEGVFHMAQRLSKSRFAISVHGLFKAELEGVLSVCITAFLVVAVLLFLFLVGAFARENAACWAPVRGNALPSRPPPTVLLSRSSKRRRT